MSCLPTQERDARHLRRLLPLPWPVVPQRPAQHMVVGHDVPRVVPHDARAVALRPVGRQRGARLRWGFRVYAHPPWHTWHRATRCGRKTRSMLGAHTAVTVHGMALAGRCICSLQYAACSVQQQYRDARTVDHRERDVEYVHHRVGVLLEYVDDGLLPVEPNPGMLRFHHTRSPVTAPTV